MIYYHRCSDLRSTTNRFLYKKWMITNGYCVLMSLSGCIDILCALVVVFLLCFAVVCSLIDSIIFVMTVVFFVCE